MKITRVLRSAKFKLPLFIFFIASGALPIFAASVAAQEKLTNQGVVEMVEAGLGDSLVISKIQQAGSVEFDLEVDAIIDLKNKNVSEDVIQAMLDKSSASPWGDSPSSQTDNTGTGDPSGGFQSMQEDMGFRLIKVALSTEEGDQPLQIMRGEMTSSGFSYFRLTFMDYPGLEARIRTSDQGATLLVKSRDPLTGGRFFIGKLDSDTDDGVRSLKVSSFKQRLSAGFGSSRGFMEPDPDWTVPYEAVEEEPGLWRVIPSTPLQPGEYGWYVDMGASAQASGLYPFGID